MDRRGPIVIIEDDLDDQFLIGARLFYQTHFFYGTDRLAKPHPAFLTFGRETQSHSKKWCVGCTLIQTL